jgi:hypothetical protein
VHQRKDPVIITKTKRIKLPRKIITVYCENYKGQIATLCGQNVELLSIKVGGTCSNDRGVNS